MQHFYLRRNRVKSLTQSVISRKHQNCTEWKKLDFQDY